MPLTELAPPETAPVTLAQVKQHLRIDHNEDNDYLDELIEAARLHVEAVSGHALIARSLRQYVDDISLSRTARLEAWPVQDIETVTAYNATGEAVTLAPNQYRLLRTGDGVSFVLGDDVALSDFQNGLEIDFSAGHGESGVDVPSNITRAILVLIAHWYEYRGTLAPGQETAIIPAGLDKLLAPVKRVRL